MSRKKWITKKEASDILKSYSVRTNEFEQAGDNGYFFKSNYTRGYTISLDPEIQRDIKTGRVVVSHTQSGGKRTFQDIWERDADNRLQFKFRNPWDRPFSDHSYIQELEAQILELKEAGRKVQEQLAEHHEPPQRSPEQLQQEITSLKSENKALQAQVSALTEKYEGLLEKTKHNARGAGRKPDPQHLNSQAKKVQELLDVGKTPIEVQEALGISRSTFFKYKKFIQTKAVE